MLSLFVRVDNLISFFFKSRKPKITFKKNTIEIICIIRWKSSNIKVAISAFIEKEFLGVSKFVSGLAQVGFLKLAVIYLYVIVPGSVLFALYCTL